MKRVPPKPKSNKISTEEELLQLDKNELVDKIMKLEAHNVQLKNVIIKNLSGESKSEVGRKREFDFTKCHQRKILLRIMYFGWDYQGLAVQEDSNQTIEHHLFNALLKCCLIQNRESSQYHRCGRTDKGVSSFGQVLSIAVRSNFPPEQQYQADSLTNELSYCKMLNRLLPKEIRAVAWMPVPESQPEYSARFNCKKRKYKYYFPRADLNLAAMREGCAHLIGGHDFRNLCKMDVGNGVTEFRRDILAAELVSVGEDNGSPTDMYCLVIEGNAFLWHQIRCIMGVLLLIGQGKEEPHVITDLLDIEKCPRKPQYNMALDVSLNLFHCYYELEEQSQWIYEKDELKLLISHLQNEWTIHNVKATMIKDSIKQLESVYKNQCASETGDASEGDSVIAYADCLIQGVKPKTYTPLLKRVTCSSLEERIEYYRKKRKTGNESESKEQV